MSEEKVIDTPPPSTSQTPPQTGDKTQDTLLPPAGDWSADWRDKMAGQDADFRKTLDRFNSPADVAKSWREMRQKMDSGEYKRNVPFKAEWSDEEKAQWRKENGVPLKPEEYKLPEGVVLGDEDKPVLNEFFKSMNDINLPDQYAAPIVDWYFKAQQAAAAKEAQEERVYQTQAEETLRAEWGPEFLANKNMAEEFAVNQFGPEIGKAIMAAGPDAVKALANIAREINPAMTIVPNSGDAGKAIADEMASLKKIIGTPEWFRSPEKIQRYQDLLTAQERMKKRS